MAGILEEFLLIFKPTVQGSGFQQLNRHLQRTHQSLFSLKDMMRGFIGYDIYSGIKSFATSLVKTSTDLGAMTSRFYAITQSEKMANEELQWTFDLAKKTAMPIKSVADSYSIFYAATQRGLGTSGARQVFQDWTEVSRVLHLSEYQFERITYALREMSSKGAIYSQDLRMQIGTHVPNAMGLAEKAVNELGVTGDNWFEDFRKKAKGNQKLINQFILLFSKYAKQSYASDVALRKSLQQTDSVINALKNTWQLFLIDITKSGFTKDLVNDVRLLNKLLEQITKHASLIYGITKALLSLALLNQVFKGLGFLAKSKFLKEATYLFMYMTKSKGIATAFKALGKGTLLTGLSGVLKGLTRIFGTAGIAGLTALFTTPPGWVILGITAIVAGVLWFKNTFPNAWATVVNWFDTVVAVLDRFVYWVQMLLGLRQGGTAQDVENVVQKKDKDIRMYGGMFGNTKYGGAMDVMAWRSALYQAELASGARNLNIFDTMLNAWKRKNPVQQNFNIKLEQKIGEVHNGEELNSWIQENKPKLSDFFGNIFKP